VTNAKDVRFRLLTGLHKAIFGLSKGRLTRRAGGMPVVRLTTVGRKSGKRRTTMLTSPLQDDGKVVLVASYGGDDRHPAWFVNLRAHPEVEVLMDGATRTVQARIASDDEKAALWPRIVAAYPNYGKYQQRTERDIPVVILEP
jgi:deazaflavin-dependent oxidoreductase (nitroreductase family)